MPYTRKELVDLRNYQQQPCSSLIGQLIPKEIRRDEPTTTFDTTTSSSESSQQLQQQQSKPVIRYTREQLVTVRDNQAFFSTTSLPVELPDDLRRQSRFRCDSNCVNERQHAHRQILKYTRNELLRYRQMQLNATSCAVENKRAMEAQTTAPEIFRPLFH